MNRVKHSRVIFGGLLSFLVLIAIAPLTGAAQLPQVRTTTGTQVQQLPAGISFGGLGIGADSATLAPAAINSNVVPQGELVAVPPPPCSPQKYAEVFALPTASAPEVRIDCNLTIDPNERRFIYKRLIFETSGVTVEGNGANINYRGLNFNPNQPEFIVQIQSKVDPATGRWFRPVNVTLRNLTIFGSVGIVGMSGVPTTTPNYVTLARNNAPRNVVFDHVTITGLACSDKGEKSLFGGACVPLYLFPGVSYFQMLNSEINGSDLRGPNIYLDDTSYRNTFRNNTISGGTSQREAMAIDGSSENIIVNNHFQGTLNHGGIYLYRNCGEGGSVRRGTPSYNTIVNNFFYYNKYDGDNPAIFVASRNGNRKYCDDDEGYPYGSSVDNFDHARFNVVMQNQILKRSVSDMIKVGIASKSVGSYYNTTFFPDINAPNYINYNETVTAKIERKAGCYVSNGYPKDFIRDGEFINLFRDSNGEPVRTGYRSTCHDGVLSQSIDFTLGSVSPSGSVSVVR